MIFLPKYETIHTNKNREEIICDKEVQNKENIKTL